MADFIRMEQPERPVVRPQAFALWRLGFRPLYLLTITSASSPIPHSPPSNHQTD